MENENRLELFNGQVSKSKFKNIEANIYAFCIFLLTAPYFVWNSISPLVFVTICSVLSLNNIKHIDHKAFLFFISFVFIYVYVAIKTESNFFGFLLTMGICVIAITSVDFLNNVFKKYIYIYSITLIPSILVFILVYFIRIDIPHSFIEPFNQMKPYNYFQYPFLVQPNQLLDMLFPRFCGYYDEPGVIGTISGVLLMSSGFNLKNKINIPIFIAGLLSFSLFFYAVAIVYGFIFLRVKFKIYFAVTILGLLMFSSSDDSVLNSYIFSRFEYKDGKFVGDNRVVDENFDTFYEKYSKSDDFYFGLEKNASLRYNSGGASYKDLVVDYGIVLFVAFVGVFVLFSFSELHFRKDFFLYLLILFSVLYQRPFITSYFYMFLILGPIAFISKYKDSTITNKLD